MKPFSHSLSAANCKKIEESNSASFALTMAESEFPEKSLLSKITIKVMDPKKTVAIQ